MSSGIQKAVRKTTRNCKKLRYAKHANRLKARFSCRVCTSHRFTICNIFLYYITGKEAILISRRFYTFIKNDVEELGQSPHRQDIVKKNVKGE
jgi:hypothetical protein